MDMIKKYMFSPGNDTIILVCGPPKMEKNIKKMLTQMGHEIDHILRF